MSREKSRGTYLLQSATRTVSGSGTTAFQKTYDSNHFFKYWVDVQTAGVGDARFYTQKFALASNTPAGMYTAKIVTSVAGKPQNLLEDTITLEVTGKQANGSGVLVYMSGTGAKTDVKRRASMTCKQRQAR